MKITPSTLVAALLAVTACAVGQRFFTNKMASAEAAKIARRLPLGMGEWKMHRFLETNGLTGGFTIGSRAGGTRFYLLSDGCSLALEVSLEPSTWTNRILRAASIQSNGVKIASITLTNRP